MLDNRERHRLTLSGELRRILDRGLVGLATEIDGILSQLAFSPQAVTVSRRAQNCLDELSHNPAFSLVAVVSGRPALETRSLLGLPQLVYTGNHGLELLMPGSERATPVKAARPYLALISSVLETARYNLLRQKSEVMQALGEADWQQKLLFENKGVTASIHYRQCINTGPVRQLILQQVRDLAQQVGLQVMEGRKVIELRPPVETNKGTAILDFAELYNLNSLIYLGCDQTDMAAFQAIRRLEQEHLYRSRNHRMAGGFQSLSVGVYSPEMPPIVATCTDLLLDGVEGVEGFLEELVACARLS